MTQHFSADLHLGHGRILELSRRPFADLAAMEAAIIDNWRRTVAEDDIVWVLGDVSIDSQWRHGLEVVAGLPGHKRLVTGNHDACWAGKRDFHRTVGDYLEVFEVVTPFARIKLAGRAVLLSHFPYDGDHPHLADRYTQYRLRDEGLPLLCGHVHGTWRERASQNGTSMLNVGVDVNDFSPVSEIEVVTWLTAG